MPWIGIGNTIMRYGSTGSWTSYWATRFPSALILTIDSATQITLNWTNNGTQDYEGVSIERGTDGITYTQIDTVIAGVNSYADTTCVANTLYYYRVRYYKSTNYSAPVDDNGLTYTPELATYITGLATPLSDGQKTAINTFILSLKSGLSITNLSDTFDAMWILAGETQESSLKNLVKNAHHCTLAGTPNPTFTQFEGLQGDGTNGYLVANYNPNLQGINYTQNNASIGYYSRTDKAANMREIGCADGTSSNNLMSKAADNNFYCGLNEGPGFIFGTIADTLGMLMVTRNSNAIADVNCYHNKTTVVKSVSAGVTTGVPNAALYLMAFNNEGSLLQPSDRQMSFAFIGEHLTTTMRDVLVDAFEVYMDANGKGVV